MRHLTCKTTKIATKCDQWQSRDPNVTIELLKSISTQKGHKTCYKQGSILHYLGTNHQVSTELNSSVADLNSSRRPSSHGAM